MLTIDQNENVTVLVLILNSRLSSIVKEIVSLTYHPSDRGVNLDINIKPSGKKLTLFCSHEQIHAAFESEVLLKQMIEEFDAFLKEKAILYS